MSHKNREDYALIIKRISNGDNSILSTGERDALNKLFSTQIINRRNIANYLKKFDDIHSEDTIWLAIIDYLENGDFENADREYRRYSNYLSKNDYLELKRDFLDENAFKRIKDSTGRIDSCLRRHDFEGAENEYKKDLDIIPKREYLVLQQKYLEEWRKEAWTEIRDHLRKADFSEADMSFQRYRRILSEEKYSKIKTEYDSKMKTRGNDKDHVFAGCLSKFSYDDTDFEDYFEDYIERKYFMLSANSRDTFEENSHSTTVSFGFIRVFFRRLNILSRLRLR